MKNFFTKSATCTQQCEPMLERSEWEGAGDDDSYLEGRVFATACANAYTSLVVCFTL